MPVGGDASYFIRGAHPTESAPTLEEALVLLLQFWESRRTLAIHDMGNLRIELVIGTRGITFEVTDPGTLDALRGPGGPEALMRELAGLTGLGAEGGMALLVAASSAIVSVDTIRMPALPEAWRPEPGLSGEQVFPVALPDMVRSLVQRADDLEGRRRGRARSEEGRRVLFIVSAWMDARGWSIAQTSKASGIPASTLRDYLEREGKGPKRKKKEKQKRVALPGPRRPHRLLTPKQTQVVLSVLAEAQDNAAEASRRTGVPARTIRDLRERERIRHAVPSERPVHAPKTHYVPTIKTMLLARVRAGERPTLVGRDLGVSARTAREWAQKARSR